MRLKPYYKVLAWNEDEQGWMSCSGGDWLWTPGAEHVHKGRTKMCVSGFHLTDKPLKWIPNYYPSISTILPFKIAIFRVTKYTKTRGTSWDKIVCSSVWLPKKPVLTLTLRPWDRANYPEKIANKLKAKRIPSRID